VVFYCRMELTKIPVKIIINRRIITNSIINLNLLNGQNASHLLRRTPRLLRQLGDYRTQPPIQLYAPPAANHQQPRSPPAASHHHCKHHQHRSPPATSYHHCKHHQHRSPTAASHHHCKHYTSGSAADHHHCKHYTSGSAADHHHCKHYTSGQ